MKVQSAKSAGQKFLSGELCGKCSHCGLSFIGNEIVELHHRDENHKNNKPENLTLVHGHCHDHIHRTGMLVKHQEIEEPNESVHIHVRF